jgi:hypothetical protein
MRTAIWRNTVSWHRRLVTVVLFFASASFVHAQGLGGLSQLTDFQHLHSQDQSATAVTVQRGAAPYMREFTAKETMNSATHSGLAGSHHRLVVLLLWASLSRDL